MIDAIWQLTAGLGLFLLGMSLIEQSLEKLGGRQLRINLRRHTRNPLKAAIGGTIATAILQSSSVISLIVLAFVGARMIEMRNALGIIMGANLGTTFTGWIVAVFGFKVKIAAFAYPLIAAGLLTMLLVDKRRGVHHYAKLAAGFGLLFFGLDFMKDAMEGFAQNFDLSVFRMHGVVVFFAVGFIFTAIIQSSSASMALTLSALNMGMVELDQAAALVIGADLGTTATVILGALRGAAPTKQVALFHFAFNLIVDLVALLSLVYLLQLVWWLLPSDNPLFVLVGFHNLFNALGIVFFLPFLSPIANWLEQRFTEPEASSAKFITVVDPGVAEAACEALSQEVRRLVGLVVRLNINWTRLGVTPRAFRRDELMEHAIGGCGLKQSYNYIKRLEGEILRYMAAVRRGEQGEDDLLLLNSWTGAVRDAVRSVKAAKTIRHDFEHFEQSMQPAVQERYRQIADDLSRFYADLDELWMSDGMDVKFEELVDLKQLIETQYNKQTKAVYAGVAMLHLGAGEVSTFLNVIRQLYTSNSALLSAVKDLYLSEEQVQIFESLPPVRD